MVKLVLDVTDVSLRELNNLCLSKDFEIDIGKDKVVIVLLEVFKAERGKKKGVSKK